MKQNKPNADAEMQQTVQNEGTISGQGLMFGESVELTLLPAPANFGSCLSTDRLARYAEIRVCPENYGTVVPRCTSVQEEMQSLTASNTSYLPLPVLAMITCR